MRSVLLSVTLAFSAFTIFGCKQEESRKPDEKVSPINSNANQEQPISKVTKGSLYCDLKTRCEEFDATSDALIKQISDACASYSGKLGNGNCPASDYHAGCRYSDVVPVPGTVLGAISAKQTHWVFLTENQRKPGNEHLIEQLCESGGVAINSQGKIISRPSDEKAPKAEKDPTQGKEGTWEYE